MKPGRKILELLEEHGMSQNDLADVMGRPVQAINQIISGTKAITVQTAKELAAVFSEFPALLWLELDMKYRYSQDDSGEGEATAIKLRKKLQEVVPTRDMVRRGWIVGSKDPVKLESEVCQFFDSTSLDDLKAPQFNARSSIELSSAHGAWAQQAMRLARQLKPKRFSRKKLEGSIDRLRGLLSNTQQIGAIPQLLWECGVRLVFIEHLPKTRIDGAAFWIPPGTQKSPVVAMSLRFGRVDYFAFTLLHELSHILSGDEPSFDTELNGSTDDLSECEIRANRWAAETMLPSSKLKAFLIATAAQPGRPSIERFASEQGVHPGVVLGQLQHRGIIAFSSHRELLKDIRKQLLSRRDELSASGYAAFDGFKTSLKENAD